MRKIETLDKGLLRVKSLLLLLPVIAFACIFSYSLYRYIEFDTSDLVFPNSSIKVYDKNNDFLWEISKDNSVKTTPIKISEVPANCINGIVAVEDKTFWNNVGVDINGVGRLALTLFTREYSGGGSTITQQLIKVINERIYSRNPVDKLNEMVTAVKLTNTVSKSDILEMYLNNVFFGNLNYGIESAAQDYFKKNTKDLDLAECSYLAGVPQWPGILNPYGDLELAKERQRIVLDAMVRDGYITLEESNIAYDKNLSFNIVPVEVKAPHYVQFLSDIIQKQITVTSNFTPIGGISLNKSSEIFTTYDYELHKKTLEISKNVLSSLSSRNINNAAVVILDKDNNLLTMLGSANYFDDSINGKFNSALGFRQPGTALIPFLYSYAFSKDKEPSTTFNNLPFTATISRGNKQEAIEIKNLDGFQSMQETLLNSFSNSYIIPSVELADEIGADKLKDSFTEFALVNQIAIPECSIALIAEGCEKNLFDMTYFYSVIKNKGLKRPVNSVISAKNFGEEPENIIKSSASKSTLHIGIEQVNNILTSSYNEWKIYKGDTSNFKDNQAFAFDNNYTVGVWTGNTKGDATNSVKSSESSEIILKQLIDYINNL